MAALFILALWHLQKPQDLTVFDQPFYLGIADDLVHTGRFTDGFMFADAPRPAGMRFAPLYPALIAAAARIDPALRRGMDCVAARQPVCGTRATSIRALQFAELAVVLWLIWWLGCATAGPTAGWLSLLVAFGAVPLLLRSVDYVMTEMTSLLLCTAAIAAGAQALRTNTLPTPRPRLAWSAAAGALLGLAILTRPGFLYLLPATIAAAAILGRRPAARPLAAFTAATLATLAPWIARNALVLGRFALTHGYDSHTLVQRIAFDTMTRREYATSFLCWLPDGTGLGRALIGPGACDRFGWDEHPTSFYVLGLRHMLPETLAAAGGYDHHLAYLLHTYILQMPLWHLLVSVPLALRGAYVAHWWGFVLLFPALAWTAAALRTRPATRPGIQTETWDRRIVLLTLPPAWFMLAFNATVAVNQVRYNLLLAVGYALAGGLSLQWLARRALWRRLRPAYEETPE